MMPDMADDGGGAVAGDIPRSTLQDYVETTGPATHSTSGPADPVVGIRHEFGALLGEFRRTAVLLPLSDDGLPLTADFGGVRWIYAFSDEPSLARFATVRGESNREWAFDRVLGARLLDAVAPALDMPCGVALDVGSPGDELLLPPITGVVPDRVAVDSETHEEMGEL